MEGSPASDFLPGLAHAGCQSTMLDPLAQHWHWAEQQRAQIHPNKKRGEKIATTSEFPTALELMWGKEIWELHRYPWAFQLRPQA